MAAPVSLLFSLLLILASAVTGCDRCVRQSKAAYFYSSAELPYGACGYGHSGLGLTGGFVASVNTSLYRGGVACGACFQLRCKNAELCSSGGTKVVITDLNISNSTDFVLSRPAFGALAKPGAVEKLEKIGIVDVEYKRIPCEYKRNLAVMVDESSSKYGYLAIKFLYQGGQTDILAVDVAAVGSPDWRTLTRSHGAVWGTNRYPAGPLQIRLVVTGGYDAKWVWAQREVLPADWKAGDVYDSGLQITDIAQEGCDTCDAEEWK